MSATPSVKRKSGPEVSALSSSSMTSVLDV
jgi:hypothetical protein